MTYHLPDLRNGYVTVVDMVSRGERVESRDGGTTELTGVTLVFDNPDLTMLPVNVGRRINTRLAAVEALQLLSGTGDPSLLLRAAPGYADVLVDPDDVEHGSYGLRTRHQLDHVYRELRDRPTSRRAVLAIWREDDLARDGDRPCTLSIQFILRAGRLDMVVNMRSQDVWLGLPYDGFMFSQLQLTLASRLGATVGRYTHHVGSLHLYDRDREGVERLHRVDESVVPLWYPCVGVLSADPEVPFTQVAYELVTGQADHPDVELNWWYVDQLERIGVINGQVTS